MSYLDFYNSKSLYKAFVYYVHYTSINPKTSITKLAHELNISVPAMHKQLYMLVKRGWLIKEKSTKPQTFNIDWDYITNDFLNVFLNGAPLTKKENNKISLTKKQVEALKSIIYHHILCVADANLTDEEHSFQEKYEELSFKGSFRDNTFEHFITSFFKELVICSQIPSYKKMKKMELLKPVIKKLSAKLETEPGLFMTLLYMKGKNL
ncbi:MAG: hypothetical protein B6U68_01060 [Candidatus Aenigmarchaeota archaeon ex4484_14]|nr:MAG: hypothetical protein B6U68_01060 [Candidatus Aenigmarchaeota archaeon ex4484_14]